MRPAYVAGALLVGLLLAVLATLTLLNPRSNAPSERATARLLADDLDRMGRGVDAVVLEDTRGNKVSWRSLAGRPRALFFGFTHCAVVCPVTIWELHNAVETLGYSADALQIQFVTLDPERDTPQTMAKYFAGFDGRVDAYSGQPEDIDRIASAFDVSYRKVEEGGGRYSIDHTATVFLLDARGRVVDVIAYGTPPDKVQARLRSLIAGALP